MISDSTKEYSFHADDYSGEFGKLRISNNAIRENKDLLKISFSAKNLDI